MKSMTIPVPEGVTPTEKPDGTVCIVVEGTMKDGSLVASKVMSVDDYMSSSKAKPPAGPKGKGKKRPARLAAILGASDEDEGY